MKANWICIKCGTTIHSKCPQQRSKFYGMEESMLRSVITINHVQPVRPGASELFISYTTSGSTAEAIDHLADTLTNYRDALKSIHCEHVFVINSHEETKCTLEHDHPNLNDADNLRAEISEPEPQTLEGMLRGYGRVANTVIDLARRDTNIHKQKFDALIEEEFHQLKNYVSSGLRTLASGKAISSAYRVQQPHSRYHVPFDDLNQAIAYVHGAQSLGHVLRVEKLTENGYYPMDDIDLTRRCICCGMVLNCENETVIQTIDGQAHQKCISRLKNDKKVKMRCRGFRLKYTGQKFEGCFSEEALKRTYGLDYVSIMHDDRKAHVYVRVECNKATLDEIETSLKELLK